MKQIAACCIAIVLIFSLTAQAGCAKKPCAHSFPVQAQKAALQLTLASQQPGNLFTNAQPVVFSIQIKGERPQTLDYQVHDLNSAWNTRGGIALPPASAGSGIPLTLRLPGCGLYEVTVTAHSGAALVQTTARIAVVFDPARPTPASRWGVFTIPYDGPADAAKAEALAQSQRLLGVSWTRLNFWNEAFENLHVTGGAGPQVTVRFSKWKTLAQAFHRQGISVMGEFAQMPRALSSRPNAAQITDEGAAGWARVKPADYRLWNQLVEQAAREFKDEIQYWEVWNEPNGNNFWIGTPEEFAELIEQTAQAVKRGNPNAKIVASGFTTNGVPFLERVLQHGAGRSIDVFSFHSDDLAAYRALLARYGVPASTPLWATEEHALVGLRGMKAGYAKQFHFFHKLFGTSYGGFAALVDRDLTPLPEGLTYATAAHVIEEATPEQDIETPTAQFYTFRKGDERVAAWKTLQPGLQAGSVTFAVTPLPGRRLETLDAFGHLTALTLHAGQVTLLVQGVSFLQGAQTLKIMRYTPPQESPDPAQSLVLATQAKASPEWKLTQPGPNNPAPANDFTRPFLRIFAKQPPGQAGYWMELPFTVPKAGRCQLLLLGITSNAIAAKSRWTSPFAWQVDAGAKTQVSGPLPSYWRTGSDKRRKNEPVKPKEMIFTGGPDIYQELGTLELSAGAHTFRLELTGGAPIVGNAYSMIVEGLAIRPVAP